MQAIYMLANAPKAGVPSTTKYYNIAIRTCAEMTFSFMKISIDSLMVSFIDRSMVLLAFQSLVNIAHVPDNFIHLQLHLSTLRPYIRSRNNRETWWLHFALRHWWDHSGSFSIRQPFKRNGQYTFMDGHRAPIHLPSLSSVCIVYGPDIKIFQQFHIAAEVAC